MILDNSIICNCSAPWGAVIPKPPCPIHPHKTPYCGANPWVHNDTPAIMHFRKDQLKPTPTGEPTGEPICGACKHWDYENAAKTFGANPPLSMCVKYKTRLHENRKPQDETCFELWEEET